MRGKKMNIKNIPWNKNYIIENIPLLRVINNEMKNLNVHLMSYYKE